MRILVTGASGQLGAYLIDRLVVHGHEVIAWSGREFGERRDIPIRPVDLTDPGAIARALDRASPDALIHAAAVSSAEAVRRDPIGSAVTNVDATRRVTDWSDRHERRLVFTSTDLVFGGHRPWNREDDPAEPVLAYGRTKRQAEPIVLATPKGIVARLSLLYGPSRCGRLAFFDQAIAALRRGETRAFFEDEFRTPLDLATAAETLIRLAVGEFAGTYHVAGRQRMTRFRLIQRAATALGLDPALVVPSRMAEAQLAEPRPADVSMDTRKLAAALPDLQVPTIEEALGDDPDV